jgi:hypothetical protein
MVYRRMPRGTQQIQKGKKIIWAKTQRNIARIYSIQKKLQVSQVDFLIYIAKHAKIQAETILGNDKARPQP